MKDQRLEKLANLLVNYSTKVQPGETVFIMCDAVAEPWAVEVAKAAKPIPVVCVLSKYPAAPVIPD